MAGALVYWCEGAKHKPYRRSEKVDVEEATRYWAKLVGADPSEVLKPMIKRHNPKTNRRTCETPTVDA